MVLRICGLRPQRSSAINQLFLTSFCVFFLRIPTASSIMFIEHMLLEPGNLKLCRPLHLEEVPVRRQLRLMLKISN